jgi:hypothetical protein
MNSEDLHARLNDLARLGEAFTADRFASSPHDGAGLVVTSEAIAWLDAAIAAVRLIPKDAPPELLEARKALSTRVDTVRAVKLADNQRRRSADRRFS